MSPVLFALIREATASPVLLILLCTVKSRTRASASRNNSEEKASATSDSDAVELPSRRCTSVCLRLLPGLFIFLDQLCSLTGTMLADPVSAAAWQPSQVVFTVMLSVLIGMETLTMWKCGSMLLTLSGALCLTILGRMTHHSSDREIKNYSLGQVFFFVNCMSSSLEVILWRKLLRHATTELAHLAVMAESYLVAACFMAGTCVSMSFSAKAVDFLCPECNGDPWHVPPSALWSIAYSVAFQTLVAYCAQAWALRYAPASLASFYATAQPIMAALVTCTLLLFGYNPGGVLQWPSYEMFGGGLIVAGLAVEEYGSRQTKRFDVSEEEGTTSQDEAADGE